MKAALALLLLLPLAAFGRVGPDLSQGTDAAFFTKLRMDYANNPKTEFFPMWNLDQDHKDLVKAYKEGDVDKVIELADAWLEKCPVDADMHLRVAMCYKEKQDYASYNYHMLVFYGLLQSITSSGDGLTAKTAYKVISIREEYSLIYEIGAELISQSLVEGPCDQMELSRKDGKEKFTLFFNVGIPFKTMEKSGKSAD